MDPTFFALPPLAPEDDTCHLDAHSILGEMPIPGYIQRTDQEHQQGVVTPDCAASARGSQWCVKRNKGPKASEST
jgi:hypothetical protein